MRNKPNQLSGQDSDRLLQAAEGLHTAHRRPTGIAAVRPLPARSRFCMRRCWRPCMKSPGRK